MVSVVLQTAASTVAAVVVSVVDWWWVVGQRGQLCHSSCQHQVGLWAWRGPCNWQWLGVDAPASCVGGGARPENVINEMSLQMVLCFPILSYPPLTRISSQDSSSKSISLPSLTRQRGCVCQLSFSHLYFPYFSTTVCEHRTVSLLFTNQFPSYPRDMFLDCNKTIL